MAAKIEFDVAVKTDNAKKKINRDLGSIEAAPASSPAATSASSAAADAANKTARSLKNLSDTADRASPQLKNAFKVFGGLGIAMAGSYAANALPQGSSAATAVQYGTAIVGGALSGAAAGPWGALAGAVIGAGKVELENSGEKDSALSDFNQSEIRNQRALEWKGKLEGLTDLGDSPAEDLLRQKLQEVQAALAEKKAAEAVIVAKIKEYIENGQYDSANFARESLGINRSQQQQLEAAEKSMQDKLEDMAQSSSPAASLSPTDALSRVGGDFAAASQGAFQALEKATGKSNDLLARIERKISKGGTF